jgi:hypothetical protein
VARDGETEINRCPSPESGRDPVIRPSGARNDKRGIVPMELKNAMAEWNTVTKLLPLAGDQLTRKGTLGKVDIFLKPAVEKNPSVVREFGKDIAWLQHILNQLTQAFADANTHWTIFLAHEKDPKKKAADKAVVDKVLNCLHGMLEALARQIKLDNDLQDQLNAALKKILIVGDTFVKAPFKDNMEKLNKAIQELESLTTKSQSWNGPLPKYMPKDPNFLTIPEELGKLAWVLVGAQLKAMANVVDDKRNEFNKKCQLLKAVHV